jgi:hypothetical protein
MSSIDKINPIRPNNLSSKYGILAGLSMALFLLVFQVSGNDYSPFLKLCKYGILGVAIVLALMSYKNSKRSKGVFIKGMIIGNKLSLVAAAILAMVNILLFLSVDQWAFSKYGVEPSSIGQSIVISGILFFETFVFGMIITLTTLQFLKERVLL